MYISSQREKLEDEVCEVALWIARRYADVATHCTDGFSEVAHGSFTIRRASPFSKRRKAEQLSGAPVARNNFSSSFELEIWQQRERIFHAVWVHENEPKTCVKHVGLPDEYWESRFLREMKALLSEEISLMPIKILRQALRRTAAFVKRPDGYTIKEVGCQETAPVIRLLARKGLARKQIAVRTSHNRKVELTRKTLNTWRRADEVDEVLVAAIANDDPRIAEVFCFPIDVILRSFKECLHNCGDVGGGRGKLRPVSMSLDGLTMDPEGIRSNLKKKAKWSKRVPLQVASSGASLDQNKLAGFFDRTTQEFAAILGLEVSNVSVDFRITGRGNKK